MTLSLADVKSAKQDRPPRIILAGVEKVGKSTFASNFPGAVFLPVKGEEGIDALSADTFPVIKEYESLMESLRLLYKEDHKFSCLVVDSISAMEPLIWQYVCEKEHAASIEKVGGGYGKGYTEALLIWREVMGALDALRAKKNMTVIVIGHVVVKTFTDPQANNYDQYQLDLNVKATNSFYRWADAILFCNKKVLVKTEDKGFNKKAGKGIGDNESYLYTQKRPAHPGGGRGIYGQLPYELPLKYQAFDEALTNIEKGKQ